MLKKKFLLTLIILIFVLTPEDTPAVFLFKNKVEVYPSIYTGGMGLLLFIIFVGGYYYGTELTLLPFERLGFSGYYQKEELIGFPLIGGESQDVSRGALEKIGGRIYFSHGGLKGKYRLFTGVGICKIQDCILGDAACNLYLKFGTVKARLGIVLTFPGFVGMDVGLSL
ncbi:hypothetical protein CH333_01475 [candidate division WOR-3 bacterium JGI_Cruoil_03_44_89]|uniref:Uncharacterized protein n=1 Tax=candidate division WOR-3 bacterium JGI_Cruoil_03_44_89 TaxID=1973748 RepID=A0A235BY14_UNCW3|nr:MAG: hypothetical protein CH333_01475 [candidate division WOR-3 bacterium JGI_Cruoil_03_44_89]